MDSNSYVLFLHARNVSERLLRSHSASDGSFAKGYHMDEAMKALNELAAELGLELVQRQPASTVTILPLDIEEEAA